MQLNADMSGTMTERFNVAGALLVKLFGRPDAESKGFSRRAGAGPGRRDPAGPARPVSLRRPLAGGCGRHRRGVLAGGREAVKGTLGVGTVVALAAYVTRFYSPLTDLATTRSTCLGPS